MKKALAMATVLCMSVFLTACGVGPQKLEVKKYLKHQYGTDNFKVEKIKGSSPKAYTITPEELPEIQFTVTEVDKNKFQDDYPDKMLYGQADSLELDWEKTDSGYNVIIYYSDYASIGETAGKVVQLTKDCGKSQAFNPIKDGCVITLLPKNAPGPLYPGYEIHLNDRSGYKTQNENFNVRADSLEPEKLAEDVRLCHIYNVLNYSMVPDNPGYSDEDLKRYNEMCTGAMGKANEQEVVVYDLVDMKDHELDFGDAYQILKEQGLVTETGDNRFTASGNGQTVEISIAFTEEGPESVWKYIETEGQEIAEELEALHEVGGEDILSTVVEVLTGQHLSDTTPQKEEARKEEERLKILPDITECFNTATPVGQAMAVNNIHFTALSAEVRENISDSTHIYTPSAGQVCLLIRANIENRGNAPVYLFNVMLTSENHYSAIVSDRDAHVYKPSDIFNMGFDDVYETLQPGESAEGNILFVIPAELAAQPENLVMAVFNSEMTYNAFQIPQN